MATLYVKNTGSNTAPYDTWAKAATTLATAATASAAGDTIWVSQNHSESTAGGVTITFPNTNQTPVFVVCGDDGAEPPTALATGASVAMTSGSNNSLNVGGSFYMRGITFTSNGTSGVVNNFSNTAASVHTYDSCQFINTSTNNGYQFGGTTRKCTLRNCDFKIGVSTSSAIFNGGYVEVIGGSLLSGGVNPTAMFSFRANGRYVINGFDLSNASTTVNLASESGTNQLSFCGTLRNIKVPSSWTGTVIATPSSEMQPLGAYNVDSTGTNYKLLVDSREGLVRDETTIVRTNGATDGVTALAWKLTSQTVVAGRNDCSLISPDIAVWNNTTGLQLTATVEIVSDGASALNNDQVWLELDYLSSSGSPIATRTTNRNDFVTAASAQTSSSEAWPNATGTGPNGSSTWQKQKLQISFTPQLKGIVLMRVFLAKASWTIYVDPKVTLQ